MLQQQRRIDEQRSGLAGQADKIVRRACMRVIGEQLPIELNVMASRMDADSAAELRAVAKHYTATDDIDALYAQASERPFLRCPVHEEVEYGGRIRVLLRVLPDSSDLVTNNTLPAPLDQLHHWINFSGTITAALPVQHMCTNIHGQLIFPRNTAQMSEEEQQQLADAPFREQQELDLPVQTIILQPHVLKHASGGTNAPREETGASGCARLLGVPTRVEVIGEQAGAFAVGDEVAGFGFFRSLPERTEQTVHGGDRESVMSEAGLQGGSIRPLIQANNLLRTCSREWIDERLHAPGRIACLRDLIDQASKSVLFTVSGQERISLHDKLEQDVRVSDWWITEIMIDAAFSQN
jgi:hypothetical protein